jgi:3-phenylpropionate/trans-cinnamate dioxygenase ferredoxin reductase subunit
MADRHVDHLLIGGGIASASCAHALRESGADGSILLVSRELDPPYHRPPASKGYLRGVEERESAHVHATAWYDEAGVELLTRTSVLALDPAAKVARLSTKEEVGYGTALLATGAMVRRLQLEGAQLEGIHYLRALGNADAIRADVASAERVVCIGGSYIGCEVAASMVQQGKACTIVMLEEEPMERGFGQQVGRYVRGLLEHHGVEVLGQAEVSHFVGETRISGVVLKDGREVRADVVVCGTGVLPDVMLAKRAGLDLGPRGGVLCDAQLQTSAESLYAAGDMCEYRSAMHGGSARIEHERVAERQGALVARNMLGRGEEYRDVPYFWTDLADWTTLEYVGLGVAWEEEVLRGATGNGGFSMFYLAGGRVVAALTADGHGDLEEATKLIASGSPVGASSLR